LQALDRPTLDWLTDRILEALAEGGRVGAVALQLLLRRVSANDRDDLAGPLGAAMAIELEGPAEHGRTADREEWLVLFSEASAISDDARLARAAEELLPDVRDRWSSPAVDIAMRSIDASLLSVHMATDRGLAAAAIDALERVIAGAYRPGSGVSHDVGAAAFVRGGLGDHVRSASALLTGYMLAGRLPYAMLADELTQSMLRTAWPHGEGLARFALECDAARLLSRLAALHRDEEYQRTAVLPVGADYADSAGATLAALAPAARQLGVAAAPFGLALAEWLDLQ
jgi:uncharacterized protein YyaL (SSP411 family)